MAKWNLFDDKDKKKIKKIATTVVLMTVAGVAIMQFAHNIKPVNAAGPDWSQNQKIVEEAEMPETNLPEDVRTEAEQDENLEKGNVAANQEYESVNTMVRFTVTEKPKSQIIDGNVCVDIPVQNITGERNTLHFSYPQSLENNKSLQVLIDNLDVEHMMPGSTLDFEVDSEKFGTGIQLYASAQTDFVKNALRGTNQEKINDGSILEVDLNQIVSSIDEHSNNFMTTIKLSKMNIHRDNTLDRAKLDALESQYVDEHPFVSEEDYKYADQEKVEKITEEKAEEQKAEMEKIDEKKSAIDKEMEEKAQKQLEEQKKNEEKNTPSSEVIVDNKNKEQKQEEPAKKVEEEKKEELQDSKITGEVSEYGNQVVEENGSSTKEIDEDKYKDENGELDPTSMIPDWLKGEVDLD